MRATATVFAVSAAALVLAAGTLVVAGPLNPSAGPVASTYKTLTEVEPRIAINAANTPGDATTVFKITKPGSYYLTGNVSGQPGKDSVIIIAADGVTLDLNGYSIIGSDTWPAGVAQYCVNANAVKGTTIRNGTLKFAATNHISMSTCVSTRVENIHCIDASETSISVGTNSTIVNCSVKISGTQGIVAYDGSVISHCTVANAGDVGIYANRSSITDCTVTDAGGTGFSLASNSVATNCTASQCNSGFGAGWGARFINCGAESCTGDGFLSGFNAVIESCTATLNGGDGFELSDAAIIRNSTTYNNYGHGINALGRSTILSNNCTGNGSNVAGTTSAGIFINGADCRVEANNLIGNDWGIRAAAAGNLIIRNTASGNTTANYSSAAGNVWGPVVQGTTAGSFTANIQATSTGSTDPNTNYSY
ncbi:MAG: right-handed parallel beta-helix repeat-containing protein [Planctomycetota bacterium]|nr:right-handed parallel beta-helix repeat-containing protein [Planctomycetota bacterium]